MVITLKKVFVVMLMVVLVGALMEAKADPPGTGWTLTFSDEFNGQSTYNHSAWRPYFIDGNHTLAGNSEAEWYVDSLQNIDLSSGTSLKLTAIANTPHTGYPYSSGMLESDISFNQAFGYFECYAKVPAGKGVWPAFWLLEGNKEGASYAWPPEIDVMEYVGSLNSTTPYTDFMTNHYSINYPLDGNYTTTFAEGANYYSSQALSQGFHKFAVDWEPDSITWYVDDVPRFTSTNHVPYTRAMYMLLNLAIGGSGSWPGAPDANTVFPSVFEVDYVRAYTRNLPSPWAAADVGSPTNAGRTYVSNSGLINVMGSGAGITGTSDQFHFAYVPLNGDGTIIARVKNEVGTNSSSVTANAGTLAAVMIRETLAANSSYALMALEPTGGNVYSMRTTTSGTATKTVVGGQAVPGWLKVSRAGTTFTMASSPDGTNWTTQSTGTITMATSAYVGLAVTSNASANRATAQFDHISITGSAAPTLTSIVVTPPSASMEPSATQPYTATAFDQYGNPLSSQPTFTWTVTGGGAINASGLFTAGTTVGGPYIVKATSGSVNGTANVSVVNTPTTPYNLTATAATMLNGWIKLNWTDVSNIETGYSIERYNNSTGTFDHVATVAANVTTLTQTGMNMPSGPYTYRVMANGTGGLDSIYSNTVTISLPTPPPGPTGLAAIPGLNQVVVSWSGVSGATNYNVARATVVGGPYSVIKYNTTATSYTDTTAVADTTYYYKVQWNGTYNGQSGASQWDSPVSATPFGTLASIVVTPSTASVQNGLTQQFSAVGKDSGGLTLSPQPTFTWSTSGGGTINSSGLYTATTVGGPFTVTAASGSINGTAVMNVTPPPPVLTTISVTPANTSVVIAGTQQYTAVGLDQYGSPMSPQPTFSWNASGGGTINSSGLYTATTAGGPFTITATSGSIQGTTTVTVSNGIPVAPSNVVATYATMLNGWFTLTWTDNSSNETGFTIQSYNGSTWSTYATVGANITTYTRTGLSMPSGPYTMRVIATNSYGSSTPSNQVAFSLPTPPDGPTGLTATPGTAKVTLSWNAASGATNYNVARATTVGGSYSVIKYNTTGITYVDSTAVSGTTYYYKVQWNGTYNGQGGASLWCSPVSGTAN